MQDREIAYEQNVSGLEIAWADRIASFAREAVEALTNDDLYDYGDDIEGLQSHATEAVAARLLDSPQWENVEAKDISDIAYEAVGRVIDSRRPIDSDDRDYTDRERNDGTFYS